MNDEQEVRFIERKIGEAVIDLMLNRKIISRSDILNYLKKEWDTGVRSEQKEALRKAIYMVRRAK